MTEAKMQGIWLVGIGALLLLAANCKDRKIEVVQKDFEYHKAGAPCVTARDCQPGLSCMREWAGLELKNGMCTNKCGFHEPMTCSPGDLCVSFANSLASYCLPQCRNFLQCREGYQCLCVGSEKQCKGETAPRACVPEIGAE